MGAQISPRVQEPGDQGGVVACRQAPSRAIARELAAGARADYADLPPSALACFATISWPTPGA
jgi:hypothetical protein